MATQHGRADGGPGSDWYRGAGAGRAPDGGWEREGRQGNDIGNGKEERFARSLGWFSIGLGLAEVAVPGGVARLIGVRDDDDNRAVLRGVGLREIASGVGILSRPRPAGWLWSRVAGDLMDLTLLGRALGAGDAQKERVAATTAAVVGVTVLDLIASDQLSRSPGENQAGVPARDANQVTKTLTINRPADELYRFWHDFQNLPRFMSSIESVEVTGDKRSHWRAKGPAGAAIEWDAEIVDDRPNELIAWRSLPGSDVQMAGAVRFQPAPRGQGTEVRVEMRYTPPGGVIGATFARLFGGALDQVVLEDLRRFKQWIEVGEIPVSDASIRRERPAQPPPDGELLGQAARPLPQG